MNNLQLKMILERDCTLLFLSMYKIFNHEADRQLLVSSVLLSLGVNTDRDN